MTAEYAAHAANPDSHNGRNYSGKAVFLSRVSPLNRFVEWISLTISHELGKFRPAEDQPFANPSCFGNVDIRSTIRSKQVPGVDMGRINPEYLQMVMEQVNQCPYFRLLSMELKEMDIGKCLVEIDLQEKHLQPFGVVHGGVFSTIIDAATFWAVFPEIDEKAGMTSVDLKLDYLAPATAPGKLIARGRRVKIGKTLGLGVAEVTNEKGKIVAHGTSAIMVLEAASLSNQEFFPKKFIET